jgi:MFS family permease
VERNPGWPRRVERAFWRNFSLDLTAAAGVGVTLALVGSILPSVARKEGLDPIGLAALGAAPFLANLLSGFSGRVGPRSHRQTGVVRAAGAALLLVLLVTSAPVVLILAALGFWISLSISAPFQLRLWGAMYPSRLRGRVVGAVGTSRAAAAAVAALVAGILADQLGGTTVVALGALIGVVTATAYHALHVPPTAPAPRFSPRDAVRILGARPVLRRIVLAQAFYGGGLIAAAPLYALVYIDRLGMSLTEVGIVGILGASATTFSYYAWGAAADRFGPIVLLRAGSALGTLALVAITLTPTALILWPAAVAAGIASAAIDLGINATIMDETPLHERAGALAGWNTVTGARGIAAPFVAAGLVQFGIVDMTTAMLLCAAVAVVGVVMFSRVGGARSGRLTTDTGVIALPAVPAAAVTPARAARSAEPA